MVKNLIVSLAMSKRSQECEMPLGILSLLYMPSISDKAQIPNVMITKKMVKGNKTD